MNETQEHKREWECERENYIMNAHVTWDSRYGRVLAFLDMSGSKINGNDRSKSRGDVPFSSF